MQRMARIVLIVLAGVTLLLAIRQTWRDHGTAGGFDFYIYWVNAEIAGRDDIDNIYSAETQERIGEEFFARASDGGIPLFYGDAKRRRRLDNVSSPFLYTALRWVSSDYDRARREFWIAVLAAFVVGTLLLCRTAGVSWASSMVLTGALLVWFAGFQGDLRVGNVNSLQLFAIGVMAVLDRRGTPRAYFAAAALGGMLLMFKPNFLWAVLLVLFAHAAARDWRRLRTDLAGGLAGSVAAFVIASISYGSARVWLQWPQAAGEFWTRLQGRLERNVAPALPLFQEYGVWVSHALTFVLLAAACIAIWFGRRRRDAVLIAGTGLLIYLLASTVVWLHYLVLALPAAIALMRWRATAVASLIALAIMAEEPFEMVARRGIYPDDAQLITPGLLILFVCALWKIAWPEGGREDAPARAG